MYICLYEKGLSIVQNRDFKPVVVNIFQRTKSLLEIKMNKMFFKVAGDGQWLPIKISVKVISF